MKTMKCIEGNVGSGLLLLLSVLFLHAVQSDCRLNVGVLPQEKDIINQIMDKKYPRATKLNFYTFDISISDSGLEHVEKVIEYMNKQKIHVVIGPFDELISIATEYLNITYIATTEVTSDQLQSTFQILPKQEDVGQAFLDMSNKYDWDKVSIFFDDDKDMSVVEKLLSDPLLKLKAWRLDKLSNKTKVHEHLIHMQKLPLQRSIVICRRANVEILLKKAFSLAMFSTPYEWFFYDPGDELDEIISRFPNIAVNFTLFTMIPSSPSNRLRGNYFHRTLAEDAVALLHEAMKMPFRKNEKGIIRISLVQRISAIVFNGKSGSIQFDGHGKRMHCSITLKSRSRYSTKKIGEWHSGADHFDRRLQVDYKMDSEERLQSFPLTNLKVRVVTILEKPFCMYKRDHNVRHGNDRFEGFALDILREVASILNFEYEVYLVHDGKFGSKKDDGSWNGMIGEILEGNATMSVAPLSINAEREKVVDFTTRFITRYVSVLMKRPRSDTSYFEFLAPLHPIVWFCTLGSVVFVSFVLTILERIGAIGTQQQSSITFKQSCWHVFGSLLRGSTNIVPTTIAGKLLTAFWWIFVLIIITSYTANLTAFLTVTKIKTPIKSVKDLTTQSKVHFGTVRNSGIASFFEATHVELFKTLWKQMSEIGQYSFVNSSQEGFKRVSEEPYAFFWDSTVNKYKTGENCDFVEIGPSFGPKGFGIAVPTGAIYKEELSLAILKLGDTGRLEHLQNRWWAKRQCPDQSSPTDETLHFDKLAGVFIILIVGVAVAITVCLGEYLVGLVSKKIKKERGIISGIAGSKSRTFEKDRHSRRFT